MEMSSEKQKRIEARILNSANPIIIQNRLNVTYSNFHTWEHFRNFKTKEEAKEAALPEKFQSFQNCFFMANSCAEALRKALLTRGMPIHARRVEIATNSWFQRPKSARQYHCLVMVRLPDSCIVLDPTAHHYAFRVPLGKVFRAPWPSTSKFCYIAIGGARLLIQCDLDSALPADNALKHPMTKDLGITYEDPFRSIAGGFKGGIANLAYRSDAYIGRLPGRRSIIVDAVWDHRPTTKIKYAAFNDGSGRYIVNACHITIDLKEHSLCVDMIPAEWLAREDNSSLSRRLNMRTGSYVTTGKPPLYYGIEVSLATYKDVHKGFTQRTMDTLEFMDTLSVALGMPGGELLRIANVMLEVWKEEDRKAPQKDLKRKRRW
jgi:hypothetical protein